MSLSCNEPFFSVKNFQKIEQLMEIMENDKNANLNDLLLLNKLSHSWKLLLDSNIDETDLADLDNSREYLISTAQNYKIYLEPGLNFQNYPVNNEKNLVYSKRRNPLVADLLEKLSKVKMPFNNAAKENVYDRMIARLDKEKIKAKLEQLSDEMSKIVNQSSVEYEEKFIQFKLLENAHSHLKFASGVFSALATDGAKKSIDNEYENLLSQINNCPPSKSIKLLNATDFFNYEQDFLARLDMQRQQQRFNLLEEIKAAHLKFRQLHLKKRAGLTTLIGSAQNYFNRFDEERKKDEERRNKERMKRLMMEDEVGYRKLIDEQKDQRLHYLLEQTDNFIRDISQLVREYKVQRDTSNITPEDGGNSTAATTTADKSFKDEPDLCHENNLDSTQPPPSNDYYQIAHSVSEHITHTPDIMVGGQLKSYQIKGLEWLVSLYNNNLNGILADEMGLGKTIQTIALISYLVSIKRETGPFLIVVPLSTISNWQLECEKWVPTIETVSYKGSLSHRKAISSKLKHSNFTVLLTTYEYVVRDKNYLSKINWLYVIVDEGHRMKNRDSKITQTIVSYYNAQYRLLLTGTPLQNNLSELWGLLNFLLPTIFNCSATFEQWFNAPFAGQFDQIELNEEENVLVINRLHKILRPFLLRRVKKEVESQLPDKIEYVIPCAMSCLQQIIYRSLRESSILIGDRERPSTNGPSSGSRMMMNTLMQLRKICSHPYMFPHIEQSMSEHFELNNMDEDSQLQRMSGKFELLDRILPKMKSGGHRVLIFSQMTSALNVLERYLTHKGYLYLRLDGRTKSEERGHLLKMFNSEDSPYFVFIMSTRAGGLGLNLQTADTVILFDSDWNPQQDLQAQDRAHRIGQTNKVLVLRFITVHSVEERILSVARNKLSLDGKIIQAGMFNQNSTEGERRAFLEKLFDDDQQAAKEEMGADIPDDDNLNMMLARSEEEIVHFQNIDNERFTQEKHLLESTNSSYGIQPRLITEEELPQWTLDANTKLNTNLKGDTVDSEEGENSLSDSLGIKLRERARI